MGSCLSFDVLIGCLPAAGKDHAEMSGDPLRHRESIVDIERVVLLRVDHVSKGSIQPILGIRKNG